MLCTLLTIFRCQEILRVSLASHCLSRYKHQLSSKIARTWSISSRPCHKLGTWFCPVRWESTELGRTGWRETWRQLTEHARLPVPHCGTCHDVSAAQNDHSMTYDRALRSLMSSSQSSTSHQGITAMPLLSRWGTRSSQFVISFSRESKTSRARRNISF